MATIRVCDKCGTLVLHPGIRKARPLEVDTLLPHRCAEAQRRDAKRPVASLDTVERAWINIMAHLDVL